MSLYSLATQDKAWAIYKLDGDPTEVSGNGLTSSSCTVYGNPAIQLSSASGGLASYSFDSVDDYLAYLLVRSPSNTTNYRPVSIEAVFKMTPGDTRQIQAVYSASGLTFGTATTGINNTPKAYIRLTGSVESYQVYGSTNLQDGNYHHVFATCDSTSIRMYVDGVLEGITYFSSGWAPSVSGHNTTQVGNESGAASNRKFNGTIDFVAHYISGYNSTPTITEQIVTNHYNDYLSTKNSYVTPSTLPYQTQVASLTPKIWYKFNETAGTPVNSGSLSVSSTFNNITVNQSTEVDGRAISFNGTNSYITIPPLAPYSLFNDRSFTIETWFKTSNDGSLYNFNGGSGNTFTYLHVYLYQNKLGFFYYQGGSINDTFTTTNSYTDNKWHHVVVSVNTTSIKYYVDGVLLKSVSSGGSTLAWDQDVTPGDLNKLIGAEKSGNSPINFFNGYMDEFAIYDRALTPAEILLNFTSGVAVAIYEPAATASSLLVKPAISTQAILSIAPMTASASLPNALFNQTNFPTTLESKMLSLTTNDLFLFKEKTPYSIGNNLLVELYYNSKEYYGNGPSGAGTISVGSFVDNGNARIGTVDTMADGDMTLGIWFKLDPNAPTDGKKKYILSTTPRLAGSGKAIIDIYHTDGKISYRYKTSNTDTIHDETTDLRDGKWHFAAIRCDLSTIKYYLDGSEVHSSSFSGSRGAILAFWLGTFAQLDENSYADSTYIYLSNFFIANSADINGTQISQIYNAGNITPQAGAMIPIPVLKFNNAFDYFVESHNPPVDLRFNEGNGSPLQNFGSEVGILYGDSGTILKHIPTKNRYAYNYNEVTSYNDMVFNYLPLENDTVTYALYANMATPNAGENHIYLITGGDFDTTTGMAFGADEDGPWISWTDGSFDSTAWDYVRSGDANYLDGWHLYVAVKDGEDILFYIDGKLIDQTTSAVTTPTVGDIVIGGVENFLLGDTSTTDTDRQIDEFKIFNTAFNAQHVFELWQSIEITRADNANSLFVMPSTSLGYGPTISASPMTTSGLFVQPSASGQTNVSANVLIAFVTILHPNYYAEVILDTNYGQTAATASAELHMPQYSIGEFNSADHMDASADIVHPMAIFTGRVSVPTAIVNVEFVMPGIVTVKGARVFADVANAVAILPLPPAYVQLFDDKWFATLLEGHADRAIEIPQSYGTGTNLPGQPTSEVIKGGFLTFFNEFLTDVTTTTTIKSISSEIPAHYFEREDVLRYDSNGNLLGLDMTKSVSPARAPRGNNITTPRMGVGYFDDYERKAVRIENIEFPFDGTSTQSSNRPYNLEFSIKTTKQDQVLAYGYKTSTYGYGRTMGVVGLSDGKIYLTEDSSQRYNAGLRNVYALSAPHPKNFINRAQYLLSKTNIADGKWHHIIIQYGYDDRRTQIWIDGKLDRQYGTTDSDGRSFTSSIPGLDGTNRIRPYIFGFNSNDPLLYSDFETSAWNFYPGRFLSSQQILINYLAYLKYEPIKAEPMLGTVTISQENVGQGNRSRMLLLYWWRNPVGSNQFVSTTSNPLTTGYDGNNSLWGPEDLIDNPKKAPVYWEGWDVFPVGIVKPGASDIVKLNNVGTQGYIDIENGRTRYLDLQKDLDLSQFDTIMFANYPTTSAQLDEYIREESVDSYFGIKEKDNYADFLKSLRKAVDSGMSLLVQFDQLARDLKIYDRVERIPIFNEGESDKRAFWHTNNVAWDLANNRPGAYVSNNPTDPDFNTLDETKSKLDIETYAYFEDRYNNMRHRVINTVEYLTDDPTYIFTDRAYYQHSDKLDFGAPDRWYERFEYKIQGLQPGDEFVFGNPDRTTVFGNSRAKQTSMLAIPFENVKSGKIITAQPEKYWKGNEYVDNPYKNYAHSIALQPGDVLDGKGIGGKIFVSISEVFWDLVPEYRIVDMYTDYWIDIAYNLGIIDQEKRVDLKNITKNPAYVSATGISSERYDWATYWSRNDNFAFTQIDKTQDYGGILGLLFDDTNQFDNVATSRKALFGAARRRDQLGRFASGAGGNGQLFFQFKTGRTSDTLNIFVPRLFTRAFWWLSDRIRPTGLIQRPEKMSVSAKMPDAKTVVDKIITINALPMISTANIGQNITGTIVVSNKSVTINTLPATAIATMVALGKTIYANIFAANGIINQPGIFTYSQEEVILTIANAEAIVYVRGDKIT